MKRGDFLHSGGGRGGGGGGGVAHVQRRDGSHPPDLKCHVMIREEMKGSEGQAV